jgi:hypothetical protein
MGAAMVSNRERLFVSEIMNPLIRQDFEKFLSTPSL